MRHDSDVFLISCLMPTADRREHVPRAIAYFLRQDYPNKELVILDDGRDAVADLVPDHPQVRYIRLAGAHTLGVKRNLSVEEARGDLLLHWDDDDWYAPHRIRYQAEALLGAGAEVCGLRQMLFHEPATGATWLYDYTDRTRPWLAGGSLLYTRDFWRRAPFPDVQVGSDTRFIWSRHLNRAVALPDYRFYVAMVHPGNTSPKNCRGAYWTSWAGDIREVMGADLARHGGREEAEQPSAPATRVSAAISTPENAARGTRDLQIAQPPVPHPATGAQDALSTLNPTHERLRIGYVLANFPALSETFIRREILALCQAGHEVTVYTAERHRDPLVPEPQAPTLTVREVPFSRDAAALARAARADEIEHLHSSLMLVAHRAAHAAARQLQVPFSLTAYSGHDTFTARDLSFYREASLDPLCAAVIVEDPFMADWAVQRLGVVPEKVVLIPNSFDLDRYRLSQPRCQGERVVILAIARFVEKKGLTYLVQAFQQLAGRVPGVELWLVGRGPEEAALRRAAAGNPAIRFLGAISEDETRQKYAEADIFCLPCVQVAGGDADGVPTTVLEAMAFELPVVSSDLLSLPYYVRHEQEGLLARPGSVSDIAAALERLCLDASLRTRLGRSGRLRVTELCDLGHNSRRLEAVLLQAKKQRWLQGLDALVQRRKTYTPEREAYYDACRERAVRWFQPQPGRFLDIGCGHGKMRTHLPPDVAYVGCDPISLDRPGFDFVLTRAERLPFGDASFDSALLYAVLSHAMDVDTVLAEAARVLKPGGWLYLQESVNDPNPIFLHHLSDASLKRRLQEHFAIADALPAGEGLLLLKARKPSIPATPQARGRPLVSIAIPTYNRAAYIGACIDSVLGQTYRPVEVVVYDDGSTDDTRRILSAYGEAIRVAYGETNRGTAYAKNRALERTSSGAKYVGILDSDDAYRPRFIERCVATLEHSASAGLVYTDDVLVDADGREIQRQPAVEPWDVNTWLNTCNLRGDTWLAHRDLVMRTALHDESLAFDVDYDLFYQLLEITTFAHVPEYLVHIRQHAGRTTQNQYELAKHHAANLVKYGHSPTYAYRRARYHPEWFPAIEEGIALGRVLYERLRAQRASVGLPPGKAL